MTRDWEVMAVDITTTPDLQGRDAAQAVPAARPAARQPDAVEERQPRRRALHLRHAFVSGRARGPLKAGRKGGVPGGGPPFRSTRTVQIRASPRLVH